MNSRIRVIFSLMMIVFVALASAFSVIPARADDGAPPPPAAPAAAAARSHVPAGADVVVVNSAGHKVSLASQEAAHIVADGDPVWCPTGVVPGSALCSSPLGNTSLNNVFNWIYLNNPAKAGVIWIDKSYNSSVNDPGITAFTLNGTLLAMKNYSITVNGGWNGFGTGLDPLNRSVLDGASLNIVYWNNTVTLNNITVANAPLDGLFITSTKNILLNNVVANHNGQDGAYLDNCGGSGSGCASTNTGTVTVNYSTFNDNAWSGLEVFSNHAILLRNIAANGNTGGYGAYFDTRFATKAQPVTISSVNNFNLNRDYGLVILSTGAITIGNVTASYNLMNDGAYLDNCNYNIGNDMCNVPGVNSVTLRGTNTFNNNGWDGLEVWSSGTITASNLTANDNGVSLTPTTYNPEFNYEYGSGAYLDNYGSPLLAGRPILLTGTNSFTGNGSTGLYLDSYGAAVTVNNLTASNNGRSPYCTPTPLCDGTHVDWAGAFTLNGYGIFNNNGDDGLDVEVYGAITLNNVFADGNNWWGVGLFNDYYSYGGAPHSSNITIKGTNMFTNNSNSGLWIRSFGAITLYNITSLRNHGYGAYIDNCIYNSGTCDSLVPRPVTLIGVNTFNDNGDGLWVYSLGNITISNLTANNNLSNYGAYLANNFGSKINSLTLKGVNVFNNNAQNGLTAYSTGNILMSNLTANGNKGDGADIGNYNSIYVPASVTLTGFNTFNGNGNSSFYYYGLMAGSVGALTISNLTANNNVGWGASLGSGNFGFPARPLNLTGATTILNNFSDGLLITGNGTVNITQLTSALNGGNGIEVHAWGKITITCGNIYRNTHDGYNLSSLSSITLMGVSSSDNLGLDEVFTTPRMVTNTCPIP